MKGFLLLLFWLCGNIALQIHVFADTLLIKNLWVDGTMQKQHDSVNIRSSQVLVVELSPHQLVDSFHFKLKNLANDSITTITSLGVVNVYHNLPRGSYELQVTAIVGSGEWSSPTIKINVKSGMIANWGFLLPLLSYILLLFAFPFAFILINKRRGSEKLAELRADWTNRLHNDIGGDLSGVSLRLDMLKRKMMTLEPSIKEDVTKIYDLLKNIQIKLRFVFDVVDPKKNSIPIMLEDVKNFGQENAQLNGIVFEFHNKMNPAVNTNLDINRVNKLYLAMKEAITNAVKYSKASTITVILQNINQDLSVEICDDGVGFDLPESVNKGNGLANLIDYGREGYMKVDIDSTSGKGTCVKIYVPNLS